MTVRTLGIRSAISHLSFLKATFGSVASSSYSVLYQIGIWVTIVNDSVAIATQSILSRYLAQMTTHGDSLSQVVIRRSLQTGVVLSSALSLLLFVSRVPVLALLTKRPDIQQAALHAFPVFLLAQGAFSESSVRCCPVFFSDTLNLCSGERNRLSHYWRHYGRNGLGRVHGIYVVCQHSLLYCVEICRTEFSWTVDGVGGLLSYSGPGRCTKVQEQNRSVEEISNQKSRTYGIKKENVEYFSFVRP